MFWGVEFRSLKPIQLLHSSGAVQRPSLLGMTWWAAFCKFCSDFQDHCSEEVAGAELTGGRGAFAPVPRGAHSPWSCCTCRWDTLAADTELQRAGMCWHKDGAFPAKQSCSLPFPELGEMLSTQQIRIFSSKHAAHGCPCPDPTNEQSSTRLVQRQVFPRAVVWVNPLEPTHSYQPLKACFQCCKSTYSAKAFWKANTPQQKGVWRVLQCRWSCTSFTPQNNSPKLSLLTSLITKLIILKAFPSHFQTGYFSPCDLKQRVDAYRIGLPVGPILK